jgi:hypothetical protein
MKNPVRPKIKLIPGPLDFIYEGLSWLLLLCQWAYVLSVFQGLPAEIPVHFNASGSPDAYGSKAQVWVLLLICTVLSLGLGLLNRYPHTFNYPVQITPANAEFQYKLAVQLMRQTKLALVLVFGLVLFETIQTAQQKKALMAEWMLPLVLLAFFLPLLVYFGRVMSKLKSKN